MFFNFVLKKLKDVLAKSIMLCTYPVVAHMRKLVSYDNSKKCIPPKWEFSPKGMYICIQVRLAGAYVH